MTNYVLNLGVFSISLPEGWRELQFDTDNVGSPLTIADAESGVGALQISIAKYKGGKLPNVSSNDLLFLLDEFSENRGFKDPFDRQVLSNHKCLVGQSVHSGDDFIRVWYASDGKSVVLLTYVCKWNDKDTESKKREMIATSICFHDAE